MSKKILMSVAPLLAVAAFVIAPAMAQAAPHWYSCEAKAGGSFRDAFCSKGAPPKSFEWVKLPETGAKVAVTTKGTLTLEALEIKITCKVKDKGFVWNPASKEAGEDEITEFTNSECTASPEAACPTPEVSTVAVSLPWLSVLLEVVPIRDSIKGIEIAVHCNGAVVDVFHGTLTPSIGSSVATFGAGSGELEDNAMPPNKAKVTGTDELEGPTGNLGITAKNP